MTQNLFDISTFNFEKIISLYKLNQTHKLDNIHYDLRHYFGVKLYSDRVLVINTLRTFGMNIVESFGRPKQYRNTGTTKGFQVPGPATWSRSRPGNRND